MWRNDWGGVEQRVKDVNTIYNTADNTEAMSLLKKYNVEYIYVGTLEREGIPTNENRSGYSTEGLQKFEDYPNSYERVYDLYGTTIYRVK